MTQKKANHFFYLRAVLYLQLCLLLRMINVLLDTSSEKCSLSTSEFTLYLARKNIFLLFREMNVCYYSNGSSIFEILMEFH